MVTSGFPPAARVAGVVSAVALLYEYTGDSAAGQANGEGIMGKWYAATPGLAAGANTMPSGASSSSSGSSGGSGGGYGSGGY